MAKFYHNWASDGSEIAIDIPNIFAAPFHCGNQTSNPSPEDYAYIDTFTIAVENAATLSPATTPYAELHDMALYLHDAFVLAGNYKTWIYQNGTGLANCYNSCQNYNNWFRYCYNSSTYGNWSGGSLYNFTMKWENELILANMWYTQIENLYLASVQAYEDEGGFLMMSAQIDIMKANLQIAMANASVVLTQAEEKERLSKMKVIFLPVMAILLVIFIVYFLMGETKN